MRRVGVEVHCDLGQGQTGTSLIMITPDAQRTMMTNLVDCDPEQVTIFGE